MLAAECGADWKSFGIAAETTRKAEHAPIRALVEDVPKRRSICERVFGSYDEWLNLLGDEAARSRLETLTQAEAEGMPSFSACAAFAQFSSGLKLLFFNRDADAYPIANLSLEYVGF